MSRNYVIIQASSRSWLGGRDLCMHLVDNHPVVYWTIKRVLEHIPDAEVRVAAPGFDRGGELDCLAGLFPPGNISLYFGYDDSPLERIIDACKDLEDENYIIRIDGVHLFFDFEASLNMLKQARENHLDCVKYPDDFPVQFTSDIYRLGALRKLAGFLNTPEKSIFKIHPKYYMFAHRDLFNCTYIRQVPSYPDKYILQLRQATQPVYAIPRLEVNESRIWAGDQLSFHYELALQHLQPPMRVLDVACGSGYGTRMLAGKLTEVHGADIDPDIIETARKLTTSKHVFYHVEDATNMTFGANDFDAITSMETIEHVDARSYLQEVYRVLKPGGILILSTPQNKLGRIPVNPGHVREYSLEEILDLCGQYFTVKNVIGIKAGRITVPGDPYGANTVLVCVKE